MVLSCRSEILRTFVAMIHCRRCISSLGLATMVNLPKSSPIAKNWAVPAQAGALHKGGDDETQ